MLPHRKLKGAYIKPAQKEMCLPVDGPRSIAPNLIHHTPGTSGRPVAVPYTERLARSASPSEASSKQPPPAGWATCGELHFKTKICPFLSAGDRQCSKGSNCSYAHTAREVRRRPDLTRTKLCDGYMKGTCRDTACKWAHGRHELCHTEDFYKTSICKYWVESVCYAGVHCRHAHGEPELRPKRLTAVSDVALHRGDAAASLNRLGSRGHPSISAPQRIRGGANRRSARSERISRGSLSHRKPAEEAGKGARTTRDDDGEVAGHYCPMKPKSQLTKEEFTLEKKARSWRRSSCPSEPELQLTADAASANARMPGGDAFAKPMTIYSPTSPPPFSEQWAPTTPLSAAALTEFQPAADISCRETPRDHISAGRLQIATEVHPSNVEINSSWTDCRSHQRTAVDLETMEPGTPLHLTHRDEQYLSSAVDSTDIETKSRNSAASSQQLLRERDERLLFPFEMSPAQVAAEWLDRIQRDRSVSLPASMFPLLSRHDSPLPPAPSQSPKQKCSIDHFLEGDIKDMLPSSQAGRHFFYEYELSASPPPQVPPTRNETSAFSRLAQTELRDVDICNTPQRNVMESLSGEGVTPRHALAAEYEVTEATQPWDISSPFLPLSHRRSEDHVLSPLCHSGSHDHSWPDRLRTTSTGFQSSDGIEAHFSPVSPLPMTESWDAGISASSLLPMCSNYPYRASDGSSLTPWSLADDEQRTPTTKAAHLTGEHTPCTFVSCPSPLYSLHPPPLDSSQQTVDVVPLPFEQTMARGERTLSTRSRTYDEEDLLKLRIFELVRRTEGFDPGLVD